MKFSRQTTLCAQATVAGVGVHSGLPVNLTLGPAPVDAGFVFVRTGLEGSDREVQATAEQVIATDLATVLGDRNGPLVSTATVAAIGNGSAFRRGRDFAAWVGVVPRQYSTGGKQKLYGISKRGNVYLRRLLIHGARAVLFRVKYDTAGFGQWVHRLAQRAPRNKVVVAIANKLARIAWAVLSSGKDYRHQPLLQLAAA